MQWRRGATLERMGQASLRDAVVQDGKGPRLESRGYFHLVAPRKVYPDFGKRTATALAWTDSKSALQRGCRPTGQLDLPPVQVFAHCSLHPRARGGAVELLDEGFAA